MEFNADWTDIVWKLAVFLATTVIFPLAAKAWDWFKTQKIFKYIDKFIVAAENIFGAGTGAKKKEYVMNLLREMKLLTPKNETYISTLIDGLCSAMTTDGYINLPSDELPDNDEKTP
jgi:hypothetical protein